ncbi:maleylpyruvate isomerase family mycothiol-dependent enzyme [Streptomyces aureocirculatus]|uniref:maleylpyruvate isomerase family mycothiol-dependent enzyme n=1 Tax=Streptomyces aureocirculatus TaxID=67275 RepID=UPI0004C79F33|nr:maleylpyruvate isomerase family mycothiol-dependent enzyme [Streptomyces aureocirculatus]
MTYDVISADGTYESDRPGRLLRTERDALIPLLRAADDAAFAVATCCPGWAVRDVLAHCSAALDRVIESRFDGGAFTAEGNDRDIAERADWPNSRIVDELEHGMTHAGGPIAASKGLLDGVALGEWVHAGDVRDAWGLPGAYGGDGLADALPLLAAFSKQRGALPLHADLDGFDEPLILGVGDGSRPPARYIGDASTLVRLYAGRPLPGSEFELAGATQEELSIFS